MAIRQYTWPEQSKGCVSNLNFAIPQLYEPYSAVSEHYTKPQTQHVEALNTIPTVELAAKSPDVLCITQDSVTSVGTLLDKQLTIKLMLGNEHTEYITTLFYSCVLNTHSHKDRAKQSNICSRGFLTEQDMPMFNRDMISKSASGRNDTRQDIRVSGGAPSPVLQEPDLQVGLVPYADTKILPTQKPTTWCTCKPVCPLPRASWDQELQKRGTWDRFNNITGFLDAYQQDCQGRCHDACPEQGAPNLPHPTPPEAVTATLQPNAMSQNLGSQLTNCQN